MMLAVMFHLINAELRVMLVMNQLIMKLGELGELLTKFYMLQLLSVFCLGNILFICYSGSEVMETDDTPAAEISISPETLQAFNEALGRHRNLQHVEQILVADVESGVNNGATVPYLKEEIEKLLQMMQENDQLWIHSDTNVVYFM
ncbi:uncharacterized protein LOC107878014 isoform X2 [Capsicum annuum]|uniref:uncharacterized protein LOC107878014 isoform X2 n=1 Tax=Capsicum annuum TaxID=4072 RepID=UPI0007BEFBEE|nr:uncharacterized protein LOC107878014 isoform X2 [Capsicum annuum]